MVINKPTVMISLTGSPGELAVPELVGDLNRLTMANAIRCPVETAGLGVLIISASLLIPGVVAKLLSVVPIGIITTGSSVGFPLGGF